MQDEIASVIQCLRQGLCRYKESRPALSWRAISKQSGVNRYFIKKVIEDDSSKNVDFSQVLILAKFLTEKSTIKSAIDASEIPLRDTLQRVLKAMYVSSDATKTMELMDDMDAINFEAFCILVLAHSKQGVPREHIQRILGDKSLPILESLIEREKVKTIPGDRIKLSRDVYLYITNEVRKLHLQNFVMKFCTPSNHGKKRNFNYLHVSYLSEDGLARFVDMQQEFAQRIAEFMSDEKNAGSTPAFSVLCMDTMLDTKT